MTSRPPVRLALIGAGTWGRNYIHTINALPEVDLSVVVSRNPETAHFVKPPSVIRHRWEDVLRSPDIDGCIVATPPSSHYEISKFAIECGKAVLVEKPMTTVVGEARRLLDLGVSHSAIGFVNHIYLFHSGYVALKGEVAGRRITRVRTEGGNFGPFRTDTSPLWDYGSHDVAVCLDLMQSNPRMLDARRVDSQSPGGEIFEVDLEFGGSQATLRFGNGMRRRRRRVEVTGENWTASFDDESLAIAPGSPLENVVTTFAGAIRSDQPHTHGLDLGARVVEILTEVNAYLDSASPTSGSRSP